MMGFMSRLFQAKPGPSTTKAPTIATTMAIINVLPSLGRGAAGAAATDPLTVSPP